MSTLKVTNIQATGETASRSVSGVAAAWVNFNGTGTVTIGDSVNVASLTDNATGSYFTNFTNAMSNADYGGSASGRTAGDLGFDNDGNNTASRLATNSYNSAGVATDAATVVGIILGDLA